MKRSKFSEISKTALALLLTICMTASPFTVFAASNGDTQAEVEGITVYNENDKTVSNTDDSPEESGIADVSSDIQQSVQEEYKAELTEEDNDTAVWDGTSSDTSWYDPEKDTFTITTAAQLAGMAELTNGTSKVTFENKTVMLGADIDLGDNKWTPIGNNTGSNAATYKFKGVFDGQGYTISNVKIDDIDNFNRGFFSYIENAEIKNITLDVDFTIGKSTAGGAVASAKNSSFENITVKGSIKRGEKATVTSSYVGGIVGNAASGVTISNCVNEADICKAVPSTDKNYNNSAYVGGIAGKAEKADISDCENKGCISGGYAVGGITGQTSSSGTSEIVRCINRGDVSADRSGSTKAYSAGGIAGHLYAAGDTVKSCVNYGSITANTASAGGIVGTYGGNKAAVDNCYNAGSVSNTYAGGYAGGIAGIANTSTYYYTCISNCYNRGKLSISENGSAGAITGLYGKTLDADNVYNNYYLTGTADKGIATEDGDAEGVAESFDAASDYASLINDLGEAYKADLSERINDGFPILRWQDPDAVYNVSLNLVRDAVNNAGGTVSVKVMSADGTLQQAASSDNDSLSYNYELKDGAYNYEIEVQGYTSQSGENTIKGSFTVDKESAQVNIPLTAVKYVWEFHITTTDAEMSLKDAEGNVIEPSGKENQDDVALTETVYTYELYNGEYEYSVSKFGYEEGNIDTSAAEGKITVSFADGTRTVLLTGTSAIGKLTFNISTEDGELGFLPVISIAPMDGDYSGRVIFEGSEIKNVNFPAGKYSYEIKASGYKKVTGEFELTTDNWVNPLVIEKILEVSIEWDGNGTDTTWYTTDPSADEFYIYTADELAGLSELINNGTETFYDKTVNLMSDINLGSGLWMPIGGYSTQGLKYFAGTFDGNGHSITVNDGQFAQNETTFGLFGCISGKSNSDRATVRNLTLYGNVKAESAKYTYIGGVSGYAKYTDFERVSNAMSIDVNVDTEDNGFIDLGGLVGWSVYNSFRECSNQGNISGIMKSSGKVSVCYVGGLCGMTTQSTSANTYEIVNCYNNGDISASGGSISYSGGIVGNASSNTYAAFENCYNSGKVSSGQPLIGFGSYKGDHASNNYYLDTSLGKGLTSLIGEAKTDEELRALAPTLGDAYKPGSTYPVLEWQAAPVVVKISEMPVKTEYNDFEDFDDTGLVLTAYYSEADAAEGIHGNKIVSGWQIVDGSCLAAGQTAVTVSYMGVECKIPVTINQIIHYITSEDLEFNIEAPSVGDSPQSEIILKDEQKSKIASADIVWYADGVRMTESETFKDNVYYRAAVTLKALYEDGNVWYNFDSAAKPDIADIYEMLYRTRSDGNRTMTFTLTWKISDTLSDKASHRYYAGDENVPADYAQYLDDMLVIRSGDAEAGFTVAEIEKSALLEGIEKTYSYQGLNSRTNYVMTGIPVYELLKKGYPEIVNAADESVISVGDKEFTLGTLRSTGFSYDASGDVIEKDLPYIIAYGVNGVPYTAEKGPLYMAAPAAGKDSDNSANFVKNVSEIIINIVTAKQYQVTFSAVDTEGNEISGAELEITDSFGNVVYTGDLKAVMLNRGESYDYKITANGYGVKKGTVSGASTVKAELLKSWTGEYSEPAKDESGAYLIYNADELMWFNQQATTVSNERSTEMMSSDIKLMDDIDLSGTEGSWLPMGSLSADNSLYFYVMNPSLPRYYGGGAYMGTFDGNGHVIRNLNLDWENYYDLELAWDGSVMSYSYRLDYVGGLFGMAKGAVIRNVGVEGSISIIDRPPSTLADWYQLGGIVGFAGSGTEITGCYTDIDIDYDIDHSDKSLEGYTFAGYPDYCDVYVGGIVGSLEYSADGQTSKVENSYSRGSIHSQGTRTARAGGIVGATRNCSNKISKCWSDMEIAVSPSKTGERDIFPTYAGGIIGDINSVPLHESGDETEVSYCFALNPSITIELDAEYAHANRVIGNDEFADNGGTASYNFGLSGMKINGAAYTVPENEQSYRSAAGRSIATERALNKKAYTNVYWNSKDDGEVWSFNEESYPVLNWQKSEIASVDDPSENGGNSGGSSGGHSSGGSSGSSSGGTSGADTSKQENQSACSGGSGCPSGKYSDADTSAWYHDSLDYVIKNGLFAGVSDKLFAPDSSMTRGMFATVLMRLEKSAGKNVDGFSHSFKDVASGSWYENGVAWASHAAVVNGTAAGIFEPDKNITREQLAVMMYRYAEYLGLDMSVKNDSHDFADSSEISSYAKKATAWAYENGIMTGKSGNRIDPAGNASRAEVAAVMTRFVKLISNK